MASITGRTSTMLSRSSSCILGRTRVGRSSHVQMACKTTWSKSNSRKPLPSSQEVRSFSVYAGSSNGRKPLTKIVATIGPASEHLPVLPETVAAGMCIMRINFSHATPEEVELRLKNLAASPGEFDGQPNLCAVLLDTKGPEIRMGGLEVCKGVETPSENRKKKILLEAGAKVTLSTDPKHDGCGDASTIYVSYDKIAATVQPGSKVLLDDGLIELTVESVAAADGSVLCVVDNTNEIGERKGVNLPNASVDLPAMSEKDKLDIEYGIKHDMDFVAASFVRTAEQVLDIRKHIDECMKKHWPDGHVAPRIISKIESQEAVDNFDDILEVSDGIMVARGDLGVEVPLHEVALLQKMMVNRCTLVGKPSIVATQMLESMQKNPRPTRAEVADVTNAVCDGADAVMLSGESANGAFPVQAVATMNAIVDAADYHPEFGSPVVDPELVDDPVTAAAAASVLAGGMLRSSMIMVVDGTGAAVREVAKFRPDMPVLAVVSDEKVGRQLMLHRGVYPIVLSGGVDEGLAAAKAAGMIEAGGTAVVLDCGSGDAPLTTIITG